MFVHLLAVNEEAEQRVYCFPHSTLQSWSDSITGWSENLPFLSGHSSKLDDVGQMFAPREPSNAHQQN